MTNLRVLRGAALSAGIAAGLFGLVAFAPSAFAQSNESAYWNGAPNATPPAPAYGPASPGPYGWGYGGWAPGYGVNDTTVGPHPYWNGAPQAIGPGW